MHVKGAHQPVSTTPQQTRQAKMWPPIRSMLVAHPWLLRLLWRHAQAACYEINEDFMQRMVAEAEAAQRGLQ